MKPKSITDFFSALGETSREFSLGGRLAFEARGITLVAADFYALSGDQVGQFDAIYDRAALVAVAPEQRAPYALQLEKLAKQGAPLLLMSFLHDIGSGPPHSIPEDELAELLGTSFAIRKELEQDVLAKNDRFRARGVTFLKEQLWVGETQ